MHDHSGLIGARVWRRRLQEASGPEALLRGRDPLLLRERGLLGQLASQVAELIAHARRGESQEDADRDEHERVDEQDRDAATPNALLDARHRGREHVRDHRREHERQHHLVGERDDRDDKHERDAEEPESPVLHRDLAKNGASLS